jgi:hypothetical protein
MNNTKPEGTTHICGTTFFKKVSSRPNNAAVVCKWIKARKSWSKPQVYINFG